MDITAKQPATVVPVLGVPKQAPEGTERYRSRLLKFWGKTFRRKKSGNDSELSLGDEYNAPEEAEEKISALKTELENTSRLNEEPRHELKSITAKGKKQAEELSNVRKRVELDREVEIREIRSQIEIAWGEQLRQFRLRREKEERKWHKVHEGLGACLRLLEEQLRHERELNRSNEQRRLSEQQRSMNRDADALSSVKKPTRQLTTPISASVNSGRFRGDSTSRFSRMIEKSNSVENEHDEEAESKRSIDVQPKTTKKKRRIEFLNDKRVRNMI